MSQYKDIPQPQDQRNVSQGDILTNFRYLSTPINVAAGTTAGILPVDHISTGDNVGTPTCGFHKQISMLTQATPANLTNAINSQVSDSITYTKKDGANNGQLRMLNAWGDSPITLLYAAVNFDPTGAIIGNSFNVANVTKNAVGDFKAFYTTALPSAVYFAVCQLETGSNPPTPRCVQIFNKTSGGIRILISNTSSGALIDPSSSCTIMVYGFF